MIRWNTLGAPPAPRVFLLPMKRRPSPFALLAWVAVAAVLLVLVAIRSFAPSEAPAATETPRSITPVGSGTAGTEPVTRPPVAAEPEVPAEATIPAESAGTVPPRRRQPGEPLRIPAGQSIPEVFPHEKVRDKIQSLAATYDARSIPEIAAFLDHGDPLVRNAALQGLLQLSSPEAVPVLRAAAAKAKSAEEAEALREAADFLSPAGPGS